VAVLAGLLVFMLWYPYPYREVSGGRDLFQLVVVVDVVLGPLITFAVFNRAKPRKELRRDLAVVALLQIDRFRVVHQVEIPLEVEDKAPAGIEIAPLLGPTLISLRPFRNAQENMEMTMAALGGVSLAARPELWQSYDAGRPQVLKAAKPVSELLSRFPQRKQEIEGALRKAGRDVAQTSYLPLIARKAEAWTVLLDARNADVVGYLPLDSF
jgi:hypothetical protein